MLDPKAFEILLDKLMPVKQKIAVVKSANGNHAVVQPLGSGTLETVRVAPGTPLASGDEVYMIRSKWSADWIIQTNLGKGKASSNIQNTIPVHTQGVAKAGNANYTSQPANGAGVALVTASHTTAISITHIAKTETILVTGTAQFLFTSGVSISGIEIYVDGINMFPDGSPVSINDGATYFVPFAVPVKGIKPGSRVIDLKGSCTVAGRTLRINNVHVVDL